MATKVFCLNRNEGTVNPVSFSFGGICFNLRIISNDVTKRPKEYLFNLIR